MNGDGDLVAYLQSREIHQGGIKNDPLGIADFRYHLGHNVILCFTPPLASNLLTSDF